VPAMPVRRVRLDKQMHPGLAPDRGRVEKAVAAAETVVDLLQRDKVGGHFADHRDDAVGADPAVGTLALVNVVGRDLHETNFTSLS